MEPTSSETQTTGFFNTDKHVDNQKKKGVQLGTLQWGMGSGKLCENRLNGHASFFFYSVTIISNQI